MFLYAHIMADHTMWIDHRHGESAGLYLPVSQAVKQEEKKAGMSNERSDPDELLETIEFNAYNIGIAKRMKSDSEWSVHHICGSNKVCYDES